MRNIGGVLFDVKLKVGEVQDIQFKGKYTLRHINKYSCTKHILEKTVREALKSVTLQRSRRFLRKADDYKRAYRSLMAGGWGRCGGRVRRR